MASHRKRTRYDPGDSKTVKTTDPNLWTPSEASDRETSDLSNPSELIELSDNALGQLYSHETAAKIWGIASKALQQVGKVTASRLSPPNSTQ